VLQIALPLLKLKEQLLLPIVQGGMGVGISAHRLAGTVAGSGAVGTISSVDLRRHHPDLMAQTHRSRDKELIDSVNLIALDREIKAARVLAGGRGMLAVNVMRAVSEYASSVRQACASGIDAIVVGAGLPLDLPELTAHYQKVALIPILSDVRGIALILKKWMRKNRLPDAIVIENPRYAGGHLGAANAEDVANPNFTFPTVLESTLELFKQLGLERERIPLIAWPNGNSSEPRKNRPRLMSPFIAKASWGGSTPGRYRDFHQQHRITGTRGTHALAGQLSGQGSQAQEHRQSQTLYGGLRLPAPVRLARRHCQGWPVLHRYPTRFRDERRHQARPVFPWLRRIAVRPCNQVSA